MTVKQTGPSEPKESKEPKKGMVLYKGRRVKVKDLVLPAVVQRIGPGPLSRLSLIHSIAKTWDDKTTRILGTTKEDGTKNAVRLHEEEEVQVLTGRRRTSFLDNRKKLEVSIPLIGKTTGTDPEIFVTTKNGVLPAWKFLPDKKSPVMTRMGNSIYWDGFQAEFTTRGASCLAYLLDDIQDGLKTTLLAARKVDPDATLSHNSVLEVDPAILESAEDKHVEFGCMPSMNAYGLTGNTLSGRHVPIRFAGGHVHLGIQPDPAPYNYPEIVRAMDSVLGVLSVSMFGAWDHPARREYYGQAGEYRLPKHGVEYRTLSNAWMIHPAFANVVFEIARLSFDYGASGVDVLGGQDEVVRIIQESDVEGARAFITNHKNLYTSILGKLEPFSLVNPLPAILKGCDTWIKTTNIEENWYLNGHWLPHSENGNVHWSKCGSAIIKGVKL